MRPHIQGWMAFALLFCTFSPAKADLIFSRTIESLIYLHPTDPDARVRIFFVSDPTGDLNEPLLDVRIKPSNVGMTYVADGSTPYFGKNISLASDGLNGRVFVAYSPGSDGGFGADGWYDKGFFYNAPHYPSSQGPFDLHGSIIERVTLKATELTKLPKTDEGFAQFSFKGILTFEGQAAPYTPVEPGGVVNETPEPASLVLGLCGVACAAGFARRRWNSCCTARWNYATLVS
jgi:hypothetical protein